MEEEILNCNTLFKRLIQETIFFDLGWRSIRDLRILDEKKKTAYKNQK